jgi:hypothetical protein
MTVESAEWPPAPVNVRVRRRTGEIIPLDCVFSHIEDRTAVWNVIWSGELLDFSDGDHLLVDKLPGHTALVLMQEI